MAHEKPPNQTAAVVGDVAKSIFCISPKLDAMNLSNKIFIVSALIFIYFNKQYALAQVTASTTPKQEIKKIDNYTIQFLIITNDKKEMVMMKNSVGWHTPVIRSNEPQSVREAMDSLANSLGLAIKDLKLAAIYTHKFQGLPDHPEVSFRTHYTAKLKSGNLKQPVDTTIHYQWVPVKEALGKYHFEFLRHQTEQIFKDPKKVWGGSYLIIWKDDKFVGSKVLEEPYVLGD